MGKKYECYENVTKEILDSIKTGDKIKVNNWRNGYTVKGVTDNYFVMVIEQQNNNFLYSVCEKKIRTCGDYNRMREGMFHVSSDNWLFGYGALDGYNFNNEEWVKDYLNSFEDESSNLHSELSERNGIPIEKLYIRRN